MAVFALAFPAETSLEYPKVESYSCCDGRSAPSFKHGVDLLLSDATPGVGLPCRRAS
jgi:hypothetical protein